MRRRSGFTIVELLVALALIMFIMAVLSEAFVAGLKSFRDLKATADLAERLRSVGGLLRKELSTDHFDGRRKLSQLDFWNSTDPNVISPPREGFFRIYQGSAPAVAAASPYAFEGSDALDLATATRDQRLMNSYRATDHMLHFAVKLRGNERGDFFSAGLPTTGTGAVLATSPNLLGGIHYEEGTNVYNSEWAEVVYFLRRVADDAHGTPLFALYRRQRLLVPDNALLSAPVTDVTTNYLEMSCVPDAAVKKNLYFNNPRDITMPVRRLGMTGISGQLTTKDPISGSATYPTMGEQNAAYDAADLLLTDVISFEVRVLPTIAQTNGPRFCSLFDADLTPYWQGTSSNFDGVSANATARVFDTWSDYVEATGYRYNYSTWGTAGSATTIPFNTNLRISAIQVIIRVWDVKTDQTRQVTITQDL